MANRPKLPSSTETDVLTRSRRRCCLCFGLRNDGTEKKGQVAHLDHDPANNAPDNLAFLCFEHHNDYDSRMSQAKGITKGEVKEHRRKLYRHIDENGAVFTRPQTGSVKPIALVNTKNPRNVIFHLSLLNDGVVTGTDLLLTVSVNRPVEEFSPSGSFAVRRLLNDRRELRQAEFTGRQSLHVGRAVDVCDVILITNTEADAYGLEVKISLSMTNQEPRDFRHVFTHDDLDFAHEQKILIEFDPVVP